MNDYADGVEEVATNFMQARQKRKGKHREQTMQMPARSSCCLIYNQMAILFPILQFIHMMENLIQKLIPSFDTYT